MTNRCLTKLVKYSLNLCDSVNQEKRVYSQLYYFCINNIELEENHFYSKLKINTFNPYKRDMIHPSNPEIIKKGKRLCNILNDGLADTFSLNISNNINPEKLSKIRNREMRLIKDFLKENE